MYLIPIAWLYVVLMMAIAEATSTQGTLLGAFFTFLLYGVLPLSVVMYVMRTPGRRRARRALEQAEPTEGDSRPGSDARDPDGRGHATGDPVAPERKEP